MLRRLTLGEPLPAGQTIRYQYQSLERSFLTVRLFYGLCLFQLARDLSSFQRFSEAKGMDPLWLVFWVPILGTAASAFLLFVGATLLAALLTLLPQIKWARVAFFLIITLVGGYMNSFGKIDHNWHAAIVIAFFLSFLPRGTPGELRKSFSATRAYVLVTGLAIAGFLFCYSISGFWKVSVGVYQLCLGEVNAFHPEALAYHVTRRLTQTASNPNHLARFLVEHPWLGWGPYLTTLYGEFFAVVAAFRVRSHRVFGIILMAFHMGSAMTLGIGFYHHQLLLLVLLVASPLCPLNATPRETFFSLPLLGDIFARLAGRRASVV